MIDSFGIYQKANDLVQAHGTRNSLEIASSLGIYVSVVDYFDDLLGLYTNKFGLRSIFLNGRMNENLMNVVSGHELGHDVLHGNNTNFDSLRTFELFRMSNSTEYEANAFAAHLLIDTGDCIDMVRNGYDVVTIAKSMSTEINLMLIKLQELQKLGYDLKLPMTTTGDFLRKIKV